jgi:hypothetical protein
MTVQIKVRGENGKYQSACAGDFAAAAIRKVIAEWGWEFLIMWVGKVCLQLAEAESSNHAKADVWFERYRAIRGIK